MDSETEAKNGCQLRFDLCPLYLLCAFVVSSLKQLFSNPSPHPQEG
jgi:hypothetical protein